MIFLSQFLNLEMSSILIMIVEGFFKLFELRRGKPRAAKRRRERERAGEEEEGSEDLCVFGFGKREDMISRHG